MNTFMGAINTLNGACANYLLTDSLQKFIESAALPEALNLTINEGIKEKQRIFSDKLILISGFLEAINLISESVLNYKLHSLIFIDDPGTSFSSYQNKNNYLRTGTGLWFNHNDVTTITLYKVQLKDEQKNTDIIMPNENLSKLINELFHEKFNNEITNWCGERNMFSSEIFDNEIKKHFKEKFNEQCLYNVETLMCYSNDKHTITSRLTDQGIKALLDIMQNSCNIQTELFSNQMKPAIIALALKQEDKTILGIEQPRTKTGLIYELTNASNGQYTSEICNTTMSIFNELKQKNCNIILSKADNYFSKKH